MAETSTFVRRLNDRPLPDNVRFVSIASRADAVVPSPRSYVDGATNVVVTADGGVRDHDALPRSESARREMALALAGLPHGCQSLRDVLVDAAVGELIANAEDAAGVGLTLAALRAGGHVDPFPDLSRRTP
jgi:hypothetical protein